jgi:hypothetical protein
LCNNSPSRPAQGTRSKNNKEKNKLKNKTKQNKKRQDRGYIEGDVEYTKNQTGPNGPRSDHLETPIGLEWMPFEYPWI